MARTTPYMFWDTVLPENIRESIDAYHQTGCPTGHFLLAVLSNDLGQTMARGDEESIRALPAIVGYLVNELRGGVFWGSPAIVREWMAQGGLRGIHSEWEARR